MGPRREDWHNVATDRYRDAQVTLSQLRAMKRDDVAYFIDEIRDVLLDLKQAVIDLDSTAAWRAIAELDILRSELDDFLAGE